MRNCSPCVRTGRSRVTTSRGCRRPKVARNHGVNNIPFPRWLSDWSRLACDHKVTFRIYAPKAEEASVDFGEEERHLTRDEQGVWSITVGPLTPDFYSYTFTVDGVRTVDPENPMIRVDALESMFLVAGEEAEYAVTKDVRHGDVRVVWYRSGTLDMPRRMHVYTPPGYEGGKQKYPVFYLLHGGGHEDSSWSTIGRAGFILDNLIAAKRALPMIVVMPNGCLPVPANLPPVHGRLATVARVPGRDGGRDRQVPRRVLKEIVPLVEKWASPNASRIIRLVSK